jgi:hypothetical protein
MLSARKRIELLLHSQGHKFTPKMVVKNLFMERGTHDTQSSSVMPNKGTHDTQISLVMKLATVVAADMQLSITPWATLL